MAVACSYHAIAMESTKDQVLHLLQSSGGATVAALAERLSVGQASVRRHLDHLRVEGLADVRMERHGVGRPAFVFYATEAAEERTPAGYARLLSRLYKGLSGLEDRQVRGRDGSQVLRTLLAGVAEQVAQEHAPEVAGKSLEERVAETSRTLEREGIVDGWAKEGEAFRLHNTACPYRQAAAAGPHGTCELDRRTIELLVQAPVRQVSRIADGQAVCEYVIAAAKNEQPARSGEATS
jgi:predicted ArsR family transcriptional regulator